MKPAKAAAPTHAASRDGSRRLRSVCFETNHFWLSDRGPPDIFAAIRAIASSIAPSTPNRWSPFDDHLLQPFKANGHLFTHLPELDDLEFSLSDANAADVLDALGIGEAYSTNPWPLSCLKALLVVARRKRIGHA